MWCVTTLKRSINASSSPRHPVTFFVMQVARARHEAPLGRVSLPSVVKWIRILGDHIGCREVSCHHTLYWTPFSQCPLATSARCAANNLFICSSRTRYSHLSACWIWRWNNILHATKKVWGMRSEFNISCGMGQGTLMASPLHITECGRIWTGSIPEKPYCLAV